MTAGSLSAQLTAPNAAGVTLGHIHLIVKDVDAQTRFLVDMLGGTVVKNDKLTEIQFPGVYILLRQGDSSGPNETAVVDHFGFIIRDLPPLIEKWKAAGLKVTQASAARPHNQAYVTGPEGTHIEVFGDPTLPTPVQMDHIHYHLPPEEVQALRPGMPKCSAFVPSTRESVSRPGTSWPRLFSRRYEPLDCRVPATATRQTWSHKGHLIDHIGFEVKTSTPYIKSSKPKVSSSKGPWAKRQCAAPENRLPHRPWGVRIELTEGLAPPK